MADFETPARRKDKRVLRLVLMGGGTLALVIVGFLWWLSGGRYVETDDAYVQADKLMVSSDVSGVVSEVDVKEGQPVKKGDVLFKLDPKPFEIALANAQSRLDGAALDLKSMGTDYQRMLADIDEERAQLNLAQQNYDRQVALMNIGGTARTNVEQAKAALDSARASVRSLTSQAQVQLVKLGGQGNAVLDSHPAYREAQAARDEAARQLEHAVVHAPYSGTVTQVSALQPGAMIVSSMAAFMPTSAVALVSSEGVWVQANLKETDLAYVHLGNPVTVTIDGVPDHVFKGEVDAIAPATGSSFSVLPSENTSGNWVKVVQRIPVRVRLAPGEDRSRLRLGMSADVKIDTGHKRTISELF